MTIGARWRVGAARDPRTKRLGRAVLRGMRRGGLVPWPHHGAGEVGQLELRARRVGWQGRQGEMTRDEAQKKVTGAKPHIIDILVALGMLKLDETEDVREQFEQELRAYMMPTDVRSLMNWMDEQKLRIARA